MNNLSFKIDWDGETHQVDVQQSDYARIEAQFGKSVSKIAETTEFGLLLGLAYQRLKKDGVAVPDSYDAFLDGDPEIDMDTVQGGDEGKEDSTNATQDSTGK